MKASLYPGSDRNLITDHSSHPAGVMGASLCYTTWKFENHAHTHCTHVCWIKLANLIADDTFLQQVSDKLTHYM